MIKNSLIVSVVFSILIVLQACSNAPTTVHKGGTAEGIVPPPLNEVNGDDLDKDKINDKVGEEDIESKMTFDYQEPNLDEKGNGIPEQIKEELRENEENKTDGYQEPNLDEKGNGIPEQIKEELRENEENKTDGYQEPNLDEKGNGIPEQIKEELRENEENKTDGYQEPNLDEKGNGIPEQIKEELRKNEENKTDDYQEPNLDEKGNGIPEQIKEELRKNEENKTDKLKNLVEMTQKEDKNTGNKENEDEKPEMTFGYQEPQSELIVVQACSNAPTTVHKGGTAEGIVPPPNGGNGDDLKGNGIPEQIKEELGKNEENKENGSKEKQVEKTETLPPESWKDEYAKDNENEKNNIGLTKPTENINDKKRKNLVNDIYNTKIKLQSLRSMKERKNEINNIKPKEIIAFLKIGQEFVKSLIDDGLDISGYDGRGFIKILNSLKNDCYSLLTIHNNLTNDNKPIWTYFSWLIKNSLSSENNIFNNIYSKLTTESSKKYFRAKFVFYLLEDNNGNICDYLYLINILSFNLYDDKFEMSHGGKTVDGNLMEYITHYATKFEKESLKFSNIKKSIKAIKLNIVEEEFEWNDYIKNCLSMVEGDEVNDFKKLLLWDEEENENSKKKEGFFSSFITNFLKKQ